MDTVNIGIIGVNGFGKRHVKTISGMANARVAAVCDVDRTAVEAVGAEFGVTGRFTDYRDMVALDGLDAVVIAAPHFLHHPMCMAALNAGKHVLCEKPFTTSPAHARQIVDLAKQSGKVLTVDYNMRLYNEAKVLKQFVESGELGEVYLSKVIYVERRTGFMFDPNTTWRVQKAKAGGGIFIGRGCHAMDLILFLLGFPKLKSMSMTCFNKLAHLEVEDTAVGTLMLENGNVITIETTYVQHLPLHKVGWNIELYGTRGGAVYAQWDYKDTTLAVGRCDMATGQWTDLLADFRADGAAYPASIMDDFVESIRAGRAPFVKPEEAYRVTQLLSAGYESAASGAPVPLT
ncbi:MAG: Gfo/Idh/MocA family oxidoreductase [Phycisphaeraceae bacterium]